MRIIDRYVMRQVLMPFCIGLMVFTFLLIIPGLLRYGEQFVAKGVPILVVLELMATLIPQAIALTIPMSLLLGLLVAFGRLSADREFVAMQACGVTLLRLLRPVALLSLAATAATAYVMMVSLPEANQTFNEITFRILTQAAEGEIRPRVFFDKFPYLQVYVRDIPQEGGGWDGVFIADTRPGQPSAIYVAHRGRVVINREKRTVDMVLEDGARHSVDPSGKYEGLRFGRVVLSVDAASVFQQAGPAKGDHEMTIAELRARAAELEKAGLSAHNQYIAIHQKFSIPVACLVFAVIGVALGATNRRDGALGSFVLGVIVVIAYYIPLYLGQAIAKGKLIPPWFAAWLPDIMLGLIGIALFVWRDRAADRPIRLAIPSFLKRLPRTAAAGSRGSSGGRSGRTHLLDRYVAGMYLRIFALAAVALLVLFQISTFIDRSSAVFKGVVGWWTLAEYLWLMTPQYIYYVLPLSVLLAALVTMSLLTKNSELVVMKACGISLYRIAAPMLACSVLAGLALFALDQTILGESNHLADYRMHLMRGGAPDTFDIVSRHWAVGTDQVLYHYDGFNPRTQQINGLDVFTFTDDMSQLAHRTVAQRATFASSDPRTGKTWKVLNGWTRDFARNGDVIDFTPFTETTRQFETPSYFGSESPDPEYMTYNQLRRTTEQLRSAGFNVLKERVVLARKVSFPFVTLIMTLIAVPFGVTTGRGGAMAGIAIGIALAITYWTATSIFGALGAGGMLAPALAAWAPNLLFGAAASYLLLTVRT